MKLLLDTQSLLWWVNDDPKLGQQARAMIADPDNTVLVSTASFWEISIKHRIGKLEDQGSLLMREVEASGFGIVDVRAGHLEMLERLEAQPGHKDPFDHLILVQAIAEGAKLVTSDRFLRSYDIRDL